MEEDMICKNCNSIRFLTRYKDNKKYAYVCACCNAEVLIKKEKKKKESSKNYFLEEEENNKEEVQ
jgi:hypothetical protein